MGHRFPSLNGLKSFEAAGRHESLSKAAKELSVTPGAVGRQISQLEAHLGSSLFINMGRGLRLTETGRRYLQAVSAAFDAIDAATNDVLNSSMQGVGLSLRALPTVTVEWLMPRLRRFRAQHPDIVIRLMASLQAADFTQSDMDIGIVISHGNPIGIDFEVLFDQTFMPVCSPEYLARSKPLRNPNDIIGETLLYSPKQVTHWRAWFQLAGVKSHFIDSGLWFENSSLAYQAAREAAGIVLGQPLLLLEDIEKGRLVVPFSLELQSERPYCLAITQHKRHELPLVIFRKWILSEAQETVSRRNKVMQK
ncbi:MAG: transcriptional regulator GcvA [Xanthobacteraceae bacterium]|nr:transcriptional regulator GcvA [Xanthobacteraceae bacterium]